MINAIAFLFAAVLLGVLIALGGLIIVSWDEARTRLEERRALQEAVERQKRLIKRRKKSNWNQTVGNNDEEIKA